MLIAIWIASAGVPIPEDIALLGGGLACYYGDAHLAFMIPVAMFAVLSGDSFIFFVGHHWALSLLEHRMVRWLATPERVAALKTQFERHQLKTVFVARFLPGARVMAFLTAGAMRMRYWKFLAINGFAALISVPVFVSLGYVFGHSYEKLKANVADVEHVIVLALIGVGVAWILWLTFARSARARETERLIGKR
jgi:membrane protein DedA with SNARE-associated domain